MAGSRLDRFVSHERTQRYAGGLLCAGLFVALALYGSQIQHATLGLIRLGLWILGIAAVLSMWELSLIVAALVGLYMAHEALGEHTFWTLAGVAVAVLWLSRVAYEAARLSDRRHNDLRAEVAALRDRLARLERRIDLP